MSFLAQLRQQQATPEQGLKLCYVLRLEPGQSQVEVVLTLAEIRQGRPLAPGKPYIIQRPHLHAAPPFLEPADVQILQTLAAADGDWLQQSSGPLPQPQGWLFLQQLLATRRCFSAAVGGHWQRLSAAAEQQLQLRWLIDSAGQQRLHWHLPASGSLVYSGPGISQPLYYQPAAATLARCRHALNTAALALAEPCFQPQSPAAIAALLGQPAQWLTQQLPLPRAIPSAQVAATLTPVLHCVATTQSGSGGLAESLQLQFRYCSADYCVTTYCMTAGADNDALDYWDGAQLNLIRRQYPEEQAWQQQLSPYLQAFRAAAGQPRHWHANDAQAWRQLLTEVRQQLEALGVQFAIASNFNHHYIVPEQWQVEINRAPQGQFRLAVQLSTRGQPVDLLALLTQLQGLKHSGELSYRLADGRLLLLPADKLNGLMAELGDLLQHGKPDSGGGYCLPATQVSRLNDLARQLPEQTQWQGQTALLEEAAELQRPPALLDETSSGIEAQLRPYQWQGVCWLQHLRQYGANGLLADDMGLGKTLQTLAHLCLEQRQGRLRKPALIIAPTSLLHNWAAETQRFAPHLRQQVMHGAQRHQYWAQLPDVDIVISSYALVVNDLAHWQQQPLSWVILDEAQWIKNPRTQASQVVRQLTSDQRLCLSGTPVENHLGELWSILDYLMPGCLGGAKDFKHYFQKPIEQEANSERLQHLLQRIAPFMLRRSKDQVALDLPPKTIIEQTISLADDQQAFYDELKTTGWQELQERLADTAHGGQQQLLVLTALLKLRQACCDPQLLGETGISSSKRQHCVDMIEELVAEQRAILVFSQFTSMLELLASDLQARGIEYLLLHGQTRNRQALVDSFQAGAAPVFLISLKAGGVGLNLTKADTVIHYDPWWNSSAEQQASDRAHRIGQHKPVFVYKLLAENTIEEKIAELQQRKALLSQHVNHQAQASGEQFALQLEDLLALLQTDTDPGTAPGSKPAPMATPGESSTC